jgi:capsular polysaccharide transport system permease protein
MARLLRSRSSTRWADRSSVPASVSAAGPTLPASANVTGFPVSAEDRGKVAVFPGPNYSREGAPDQQRRRFRWGLVSFILVVIVPTVLAGVYYFIIAADQYVAEFRFALRTAEPVRSEASSILGNPVLSPVGVDSYAVVQYIGSRDIIDDVGKTVDLRAMFSRPEADWLARLELPVAIEELVRYWKNQVDGFFDASNGTIVVRARAFARDDALALAQAVLASSERLVNELSARARRDTLQNSEREVHRAERRLKTALARLREFRDREGIIDPRKTADATQALAGRIRDEVVRAETELATIRHYMRPEAPSVKMLEARIQSLQTQLRSVESEVTDTERSRSEVLSRVMGSYERLESERSFAEKAYQHALEALDRARMNADRQQVYIAGFVQPSLPEEALYPRRLRAVGIALFLCCAIWLIGAFIVQTVREHL